MSLTSISIGPFLATLGGVGVGVGKDGAGRKHPVNVMAIRKMRRK